MYKKIIALLIACLLLGSIAAAETLYDGADYTLLLPDGSVWVQSQDTLTVTFPIPGAEISADGTDSLMLTVTKSSLSFACDAEKFLMDYMEAYKQGFMSGLNGVEYTEEDLLLVFDTEDGSISFVRSVYTCQGKNYCTYIYLQSIPAADGAEEPDETTTGETILYSFTSNADPAVVEPILSTFRVK